MAGRQRRVEGPIGSGGSGGVRTSRLDRVARFGAVHHSKQSRRSQGGELAGPSDGEPFGSASAAALAVGAHGPTEGSMAPASGPSSLSWGARLGGSASEVPGVRPGRPDRWPIERRFQENKSQLGLDHYEHRSWTAWHRHMRLVFLAQLFLIRLQIKFKKNACVDPASSAPAHGVPFSATQTPTRLPSDPARLPYSTQRSSLPLSP